MKKPNVLLINCDDLGFGDLGCYGSLRNQTPAIDRLAQEGVQFTSFYAGSPVCSPSRAALMTGCYPPRVSLSTVLFPAAPYGLSPAEYTLPRLFKDHGYATKIVGKWHCGDQADCLPQAFGFDEYYGLPYSNDMCMQAGKTDFEKNPPLPLIDGNEVIEQQPDQKSLTERYVEQSRRFIRDHQDTPFFLYLAHMHVHLPLYAADRFVQESRNGDYGACVASVDWALAALVHELKTLDLYDNTILIFTSDNGSLGGIDDAYFHPNEPIRGPSNEPLRGSKHSVFEGGLRVPFIFSWPQGLPSDRIGQTCDALASQLDLLPTLCELIGGRFAGEKAIDGMDLSETFLHGKISLRQDFLYFKSSATAPAAAPLDAIRWRQFKLHRFRDGNPVRELYDLSQDVGESENLYAERPDLVDKLEAMARDYGRRLGDSNLGQEGCERRLCHATKKPKPLTVYDENHPYLIALYDKPDRG